MGEKFDVVCAGHVVTSLLTASTLTTLRVSDVPRSGVYMWCSDDSNVVYVNANACNTGHDSNMCQTCSYRVTNVFQSCY